MCLPGASPSHPPSDQCSRLLGFLSPFTSRQCQEAWQPEREHAPLDHLCFPVCGTVEGLTPVPLCSTQAGSHRGSRPPCWSSRNCTGSWRMSTRSRRGRRWRTGRRRTQRGKRTCNSPGCCSRKQSRRRWDWSTRSHLGTQRKKLFAWGGGSDAERSQGLKAPMISQQK